MDHVDIGIGIQSDCLEQVREALVFMLFPLEAEWKIPVEIFLNY